MEIFDHPFALGAIVLLEVVIVARLFAKAPDRGLQLPARGSALGSPKGWLRRL